MSMLTIPTLIPTAPAKPAAKPAPQATRARASYAEGREPRAIFAEAPDAGVSRHREAPDAGEARNGHEGFTHGRSWS